VYSQHDTPVHSSGRIPLERRVELLSQIRAVAAISQDCPPWKRHAIHRHKSAFFGAFSGGFPAHRGPKRRADAYLLILHGVSGCPTRAVVLSGTFGHFCALLAVK
jgi:hypothetical protein